MILYLVFTNYYFLFINSQAGDKLSDNDKATVTNACKATLQWLDGNTLAEKEEFEDKLKELQKECGPIMTKLHQSGGKGPTVEEVD